MRAHHEAEPLAQPLQLNETVHDVTSPGYHGKPRIIEDDRTEVYLDAIRLAWDSQLKIAAKLFWGTQGLGMPQDRIDALEAILETACGVLDGAGVPAAEEEDLPIRSATYGGEE